MNLNLFETLREKALRSKIPLVAHFDLTYRCNLDCVHCYITAQARPELATTQAKRTLEQLAAVGTLYLTLSGGEIMARKDLFEIAEYARELNFALRLLTNGTLLTEGSADRIAALYPELVAISIYSLDPKLHDAITRGLGSLQKSIRAAKMLRERKARVKISSVIMEQNKEDWREIHAFAKEIGARFQTDYRLAPKSDGSDRPLQFCVDDEYLPHLLSDPLFNFNKEETGTEMEREEAYTGSFNTIPCGAGHMSCYISPYGDVYPCVQMPLRCGNVTERPFADIWENSPQLLDMRSVTLQGLKCGSCELLKYCRPCLGLNHIEAGDMRTPATRTCREARIMRQLSIRRR